MPPPLSIAPLAHAGYLVDGGTITRIESTTGNQRAHAAALTAFAMGLHVSVYNYSNDSCAGASYISITP